jgi:hypothetical protein
MFQSRVLGAWPSAGDDSLISLTDVEAAIERWKQESAADSNEPVIAGVDVARFGSNSTVVTIRQGSRVIDIQSWRGADLMQSTGKIVLLAGRYNPESINVDDCGIGGAIVDRLSEQGYPVLAVNAGATPSGVGGLSADKFFNLKAAISWHARALFRSGQISIPPSCAQLVADLTALTYSVTSNGKLKVEDKQSLIARGVQSPDFADSLFLAFMPRPASPDELWRYYQPREATAPKPQPTSSNIPGPTAEDRAALDHWWSQINHQPQPPLPPGWRKVLNERPMRIEWVGVAVEPGQEAELVETFEQIGREQTYSMVRDLQGSAPEALQRRFPDSMDPRRPFGRGWPGQGDGGRIGELYRRAQARYFGKG